MAVNRLGTFVRSRRKSLSLTLAQTAAQAACSLSYISRLELGQLPDGPSANLLERLASALKVDALMLVQLKDEDAAAPTAPISAQDMTAPATDLERQMLSNFRAADDRVRHYLVGQAQLSRAILNRGRGLPAVPPTLLNSPEDQLSPLLDTLAADYSRIGEKLLYLRRHTDAIQAYQSAHDIYEQMRWSGSVAKTLFSLGRVHRDQGRDRDGTLLGREILYHFMNADQCFSRAEDLFAEASLLADEERERRPENLAQWALVHMQIARLMTADSHITPEYRHATWKLFKAQADNRRRHALSLYNTWIGELRGRLKDYSKNHSCEQSLGDIGVFNECQLLAEALQRRGMLYGNLAEEELQLSDQPVQSSGLGQDAKAEQDRDEWATRRHLADTYFRRCCASFRQAVLMRRRITLTISQEPQKQQEYQINRLANHHLSFAYATQQCAPNSSQYERALYQYMLAEKLDALLPPAFDPEQRKTINLLMFNLDQDANLSEDTRALIRRRVEALLSRADLGTVEQPKLMYEFDYQSAHKAFSESMDSGFVDSEPLV